jgi:hypothetical protein
MIRTGYTRAFHLPLSQIGASVIAVSLQGIGSSILPPKYHDAIATREDERLCLFGTKLATQADEMPAILNSRPLGEAWIWSHHDYTLPKIFQDEKPATTLLLRLI